jgi:hypothetical protein
VISAVDWLAEGKQTHAGKIGYQTWTAEALDIVGAGTKDANPPDWKIKFWAGGGATLAGSLAVSGDLTVAGQADSVVVTGGGERLRMLRGSVTSDGKSLGPPVGFTVQPMSPGRGLYDIKFDPPFSTVPAVTVTQVYAQLELKSATLTSEEGLTTDNALITVLSANLMRVKTGNINEDPRNFSFIVIGPR